MQSSSPVLVFFAHLLNDLKGHVKTQFCFYFLRLSVSIRRPVPSPTCGRTSKAIPFQEANGPWSRSPPPPSPSTAVLFLSLGRGTLPPAGPSGQARPRPASSTS